MNGIILTFFCIVAALELSVGCNADESQIRPEYFSIEEIKNLELKTGAKFIELKREVIGQNEIITLRSEYRLYEFESLSDVLFSINEKYRFLGGHLGLDARTSILNYKINYKKKAKLKIIVPTNLTETLVQDPLEGIRTCSPSPLYSFLLSGGNKYGRKFIFRNKEDLNATEAEEIELLYVRIEKRLQGIISKYELMSTDDKAVYALESARLLVGDKSLKFLFCESRDWIVWYSARQAVQAAANNTGKASLIAKEILECKRGRQATNLN